MPLGGRRRGLARRVRLPPRSPGSSFHSFPVIAVAPPAKTLWMSCERSPQSKEGRPCGVGERHSSSIRRRPFMAGKFTVQDDRASAVFPWSRLPRPFVGNGNLGVARNSHSHECDHPGVCMQINSWRALSELSANFSVFLFFGMFFIADPPVLVSLDDGAWRYPGCPSWKLGKAWHRLSSCRTMSIARAKRCLPRSAAKRNRLFLTPI